MDGSVRLVEDDHAEARGELQELVARRDQGLETGGSKCLDVVGTALVEDDHDHPQPWAWAELAAHLDEAIEDFRGALLRWPRPNAGERKHHDAADQALRIQAATPGVESRERREARRLAIDAFVRAAAAIAGRRRNRRAGGGAEQ